MQTEHTGKFSTLALNYTTLELTNSSSFFSSCLLNQKMYQKMFLFAPTAGFLFYRLSGDGDEATAVNLGTNG